MGKKEPPRATKSVRLTVTGVLLLAGPLDDDLRVRAEALAEEMRRGPGCVEVKLEFEEVE